MGEVFVYCPTCAYAWRSNARSECDEFDTLEWLAPTGISLPTRQEIEEAGFGKQIEGEEPYDHWDWELERFLCEEVRSELQTSELGAVLDSLRHLKTDELVAHYEQAAAVHGETMESGNPKLANRAHDMIAAVYRELKRKGREHELARLMDSDIDGVRLWTAAHCLYLDEKRATKVLEAMSKKPGINAFNASMTLEQWRAGQLHFP